jgi:hypothetical protein
MARPAGLVVMEIGDGSSKARLVVTSVIAAAA